GMGPKRRLSVAERQQRANAASAPKKRSTTGGSANHSPASRKTSATATSGSTSSATATATTSPSKEPLKTNSPAKKSNKILVKEKPEEIVEPAIEKLDPKEIKIKEKFEEKKATTRASSRENVKRGANEAEDKVEPVAILAASKEDLKTLDSSHKEKEDNISSNSSTTSSSSKQQDKKDGKHKAISKMLKSLDIKISGFDNLLPKEQNIQELGLKSSISENVKTKSRAAAVKVIASLSTPKPVKRPKNPEAEERKKAAQKQNEKSKESSKVSTKETGKETAKDTTKNTDKTSHSHKAKVVEKTLG
ncbi:protein FAM133B-like, partial [Lucilia sericata]|uniref:protein FAM133B-like n=1 Tax=Lucilia sericata TaxID=13632 RepID=UPI0018A81352